MPCGAVREDENDEEEQAWGARVWATSAWNTRLPARRPSQHPRPLGIKLRTVQITNCSDNGYCIPDYRYRGAGWRFDEEILLRT